MFKSLLIAAAVSVAGGATSIPAQVVPRRTCLHGADESAAERARREQAVDYATKVNVAESFTAGLLPRGFRALNKLPNLPAAPAGFEVQFHFDDRSYTLSLKDSRDMCGYAVFTDQDRLIYEAVPRAETARVVPLGTR